MDMDVLTLITWNTVPRADVDNLLIVRASGAPMMLASMLLRDTRMSAAESTRSLQNLDWGECNALTRMKKWSVI